MLNEHSVFNELPPPRHMSTLKQKIDWLNLHKPLWKDLDFINTIRSVTPVIRKMKEDGIYSKNTQNGDIARHIVKIMYALKQNENYMN